MTCNFLLLLAISKNQKLSRKFLGSQAHDSVQTILPFILSRKMQRQKQDRSHNSVSHKKGTLARSRVFRNQRLKLNSDVPTATPC